MVMRAGDGGSAAARLRFYLRESELAHGDRLPPERELAARLGLSRSELRKGLAALSAEGQLWRHVGRGTFVGSRPLGSVGDIAAMAQRTNPGEIMRARLMIEPELARLAALNATPAHIEELRTLALKARQATSWRQYEGLDTRLHRLIGEATQNGLLVALLDTLNAVRRMATWSRLRVQPFRPGRDHHSFAEHDRIAEAIANRDPAAAASAMHSHLQAVERNLLAG